MKTENLTKLKINKLTQAQYNAALEADTIQNNELYMVTDSVLDVSKGGTGARTESAARTNLNVPSIDKIKNMFCTIYSENLTVKNGTFTDNGSTAVLVGNSLRLYINAKAKAAITAGNIDNQTMLTIRFTDSKIKEIYSVGSSGAASGPNSQMQFNTVKDSNGDVVITVILAAIGHALSKNGTITAYVSIPCVLNWDAY